MRLDPYRAGAPGAPEGRAPADCLHWRLYWPESATVPDVLRLRLSDEVRYDPDRFVSPTLHDSPAAAREELRALISRLAS